MLDRRVLLVHRDVDALRELATQLRRRGVRVSLANGTQMACERAKSGGYDAILVAREAAEPTDDSMGAVDALSFEISGLPPLLVFDDVASAGDLAEADMARLLVLMAGRDWIWIAGNHDPGPIPLGGRHLAEHGRGALRFRHAALAGGPAGQRREVEDVDDALVADQVDRARLAREKASAVAARHADAWVIGSDQAASLDGVALGKPGTEARAHAQLRACAARSVLFHTAVVLQGPDGSVRLHTDHTEVGFRDLQDDEIARYVEAEQPLDCAGSFKCEGLGISLFRFVRSDDPSALVGLPLIALAGMLREAGFALP